MTPDSEPHNPKEEQINPSLMDVLVSTGGILAVLFSFFALYLAYQHMTTESPVQKKIDSLQYKINKLQVYKDSGTVAPDTTGGPVTPLPGDQAGGTTSGGDDGTDKSLADGLIVAIGFLICFLVLSIAFSCGVITIAVIFSAIVMTLIVTLLIPYLKRKCQKCRHRGIFGWVTKFVCFLFVKFEKFFKVLTVILWIVSAILLVVCGMKIISALECLPVVGK